MEYALEYKDKWVLYVIMDGYRQVGKYKISTLCLETFPCQHTIVFENGDKTRMKGDSIYRLFTSSGLSDPHIDMYAEHVRRSDFPTPEELQMKKDQQLKVNQAYEKRIKEEEEKK